MPYVVRMAWRNLSRNRARTLLSVGAVAAGVAVVILLKGFVDGSVDTVLGNTIRLTSGHVRIIRPEYRQKERLLSLAYPVEGFHGEGFEAVVEAARGLPGVTEAFGRIRFGALFSKGERTRGIMVIGTDLVAEDRVAHLSRFVDEGRLPKPGEKEVLLGKGLMDSLGLQVGGRVTFLFHDAFGALRAATFTVSGRMRSGLRLLDEGSAYLPLDRAQALLSMPGAVTEVVVFGATQGSAQSIASEVRAVLREKGATEAYLAIPWQQHNAMVRYLTTVQVVFSIVYGLVIMLACFVVFNTFWMIVNERRRELGMLGALGFTPSDMLRLVLAEAGLIGLVGSAVGAAVGSGVNEWLAHAGLDVSPYVRAAGKDLLYFPVLYPVQSWETTAVAFGLGWAITVLATLSPAWTATRTRPTEALRSV